MLVSFRAENWMKRVYGCWLIVYFTVGSGTTVALIDSRLSEEEDFGGREEAKGSSRQMRDLCMYRIISYLLTISPGYGSVSRMVEGKWK